MYKAPYSPNYFFFLGGGSNENYFTVKLWKKIKIGWVQTKLNYMPLRYLIYNT